MASIVIVTSQCYLLAEAINFIVINEDDDSIDREWRPNAPKQRKVRNTNKVVREYMMERKPFNINISFIPKAGAAQANSSSLSSSSKHNSDNSTLVSVKVHGLQRTLKVFQDIVSQLREQIPDELFLDRLVERFLTDMDGSVSDAETIEKMGLK
jgi:hypothetical protein